MKKLAEILDRDTIKEFDQVEVLNLENLINKYNVLNFEELQDDKFYARLDTNANGRDFYADRVVLKGDHFSKNRYFVEISKNAYNKFETSDSFRVGYALEF